jgi:hypothetical protein
MLFLGIGGVGFYMGQVNTSLVEGVNAKLQTWQKILQGTRGGEQISSGDERMRASTGEAGPASAGDLSRVDAHQESRDSHVSSEQPMTSGGERIATTIKGRNDEVSSIGTVDAAAGGRESPMLVPPGSTLTEIAANAYGAQRDLGLDLIKEYNQQIENLNRIRAGQPLWLPPVSQETLVRQQPDGSYSLILASFRTSQQAEQLAQLARLKSYAARVRARPVSDSLVLHRVEISGLANLDAVDQAWDTAITNHWIALADSRSGKRF